MVERCLALASSSSSCEMRTTDDDGIDATGGAEPMHPRERWSEGGIRRRAGPRDARISRRQLLGAGGGLALSATARRVRGSALNSIGPGTRRPAPAPGQPDQVADLLRQQADRVGLAPEKGATLQIYNWVAYINEAVINELLQEVQLQLLADDLQRRWRRRSPSSPAGSSSSTSSSRPSMCSLNWSWPS